MYVFDATPLIYLATVDSLDTVDALSGDCRLPEAVYEDLPGTDTLLRAVLASGIVPLGNQEEIATFLDRYGSEFEPTLD